MSYGERTGATTEEPVLEEVLDTPGLFRSLVRFLSQEMAHENALFLKEVRLFEAVRAPAAETHQEACRIYFTFVADGAPMAVNVGSETKAAVQRALWAGWTAAPVPPRVFDVAWAEIRALIAPAFRRWLAQREWTRRPFARLRPPSFAQVLRAPALVASLSRFAAKQGSDNLLFEEFKTTDGVAEPLPPATTVDELDLSLRTADETCSLLALCAAIAELKDRSSKKTIPEEEARKLWNAYRKKVPLRHVKGTRYAAFLEQWAQWLQQEFSDSTVFGDWLDQRAWLAGGARGSGGAAQHGPHAGDELHDAERLAQVVVRTVVQPLDDVDLAGFGRDHDDRRCGAGRVGAQLGQNLVAVLVGQHDVQNDEVGPPAAQRRPKAGRVLAARGLVPVGL